MFKRMMVLGAVASALVFTGCQSRSRQDQNLGTASDQTRGTGGSGASSSDSIPGSSNTLGGTRQDEARPGVELGGTGGSGPDQSWTGSTGSTNSQDTSSGSLDQSGIGGSGKSKMGKKGPGDGGTPGHDGGM